MVKKIKKIDMPEISVNEDPVLVADPAIAEPAASTVIETSDLESSPPELVKPKKKRIFLKVFLSLFLMLIIFIGVLAFFSIPPILKIKTYAAQFQIEINQITVGIQAQNLNLALENVQKAKLTLDNIRGEYRKLSFARIFPYFGNFYSDGERLFNAGGYLLESGEVAVKNLEPYADLLGLKEGEKPTNLGPMTAEQRLLVALETLDKLGPGLDEISQKIEMAKKETDQVNVSRYPVEMFGKKIRENVEVIVTMIDSTANLIMEAKPLFSYLKPLLGVPNEKRYLLLFQNDAELRPTGGFITAYAIISVKGGKFTPLGSFDIYDLDAKLGNRIKAPEPILKYHKNVFYWYMRDMNLSPDFKISMDTFMDAYKKINGTGGIDAVIAVDTDILVDMLKVLGPVGVGGWGNFSAEIDKRCDCPQVVYELEKIADQPVTGFRVGRKAVLGPLMHSVLLNMMQSPRKKWPEFFNMILTNIQEKHMLFYFFDEKLQSAIEALNAGGRIQKYEGDYLHVNDCNFGGAKSNLFIKESFAQDIKIEGNEIIKTLTIDYRNPAPASNCNLEAGQLCLNGLYRDWVRIYVPKGSQLIEATGSEIQVKTYEDLDKTVFEAFYGNSSPLRPEGKAQLTFKYKLPFAYQKGKPYKLLIQKQPGTYGYENIVTFNGKEETFELKTDKELSF